MKADVKKLEKEFKKLKQLDRIEFRQKFQFRIMQNKLFDSLGLKLGFIFFMLSYAITFSLAFLGAPIYGDSWFYVFIGLTKPLLCGALLCIILFFIDIIYRKRSDKEDMTDLIKEYCPKAIIK